MNEFLTWVYEVADQRDWSINKLASHMGFSHTAVHATMNGRNAVTWEFCAALANAFDMPAEDVFRRAGLLRPVPDPAGVQRVVNLAKGLSADNLALLEEFAEFLYQRNRRDS